MEEVLEQEIHVLYSLNVRFDNRMSTLTVNTSDEWNLSVARETRF
jgi:hypothetical protein